MINSLIDNEETKERRMSDEAFRPKK